MFLSKLTTGLSSGWTTLVPLLAIEEKAPEGNTWVPYVVALGLVVGVLLVSLMTSKRGHRD